MKKRRTRDEKRGKEESGRVCGIFGNGNVNQRIIGREKKFLSNQRERKIERKREKEKTKNEITRVTNDWKKGMRKKREDREKWGERTCKKDADEMHRGNQ